MMLKIEIHRLLGGMFLMFGLTGLACPARADVSLPEIFSDHMVLQADASVPVWGWAGPGEEVTVEFAGQKQVVTADSQGNWKVRLDPMPASAESRTMRIFVCNRQPRTKNQELAAKNQDPITFHDVVVGEVWLVSGQSNMAWTLAPGHEVDENEKELTAARDPWVRQFTVTKKGVSTPARNAPGAWHPATRENLLVNGRYGDSALGYFFARDLRRELKCPVGVINASVGGSVIQAWSPPRGKLYNGMIHPLAPYAIRGGCGIRGKAI